MRGVVPLKEDADLMDEVTASKPKRFLCCAFKVQKHLITHFTGYCHS